jgi:hypothetical protein
MTELEASKLIKQCGLAWGIFDAKYEPGRWIVDAVQKAVAAEREACADCVPANWLDPLLTGPSAVVGNLGASNVEAILKAVKARIMERSNAEVKVGDVPK